MDSFVISLTGHRPDKLWGYNLNHPKYQQLKETLENIIFTAISKFGKIECHSGMALGADTIWAQAIVNMKNKYPDKITFVADIPCHGQESVWPKSSQTEYHKLVSHSNTQIYYSDHYTRQCIDYK